MFNLNHDEIFDEMLSESPDYYNEIFIDKNDLEQIIGHYIEKLKEKI